MRPLPADPLAFHALVISAFCDDIASGKGWERTNALREVSISLGECRSGTALSSADADRAPTGLAPPGFNRISQRESKRER